MRSLFPSRLAAAHVTFGVAFLRSETESPISSPHRSVNTSLQRGNVRSCAAMDNERQGPESGSNGTALDNLERAVAAVLAVGGSVDAATDHVRAAIRRFGLRPIHLHASVPPPVPLNKGPGKSRHERVREGNARSGGWQLARCRASRLVANSRAHAAAMSAPRSPRVRSQRYRSNHSSRRCVVVHALTCTVCY